VNNQWTAAERRFAGMLKGLPCVVCKRLGFKPDRHVELHHIAKGSSRQNNWLMVPLCTDHHRGGSGLHGLGVKAFCALYRVPHESEYGLLAWTNQDLMEKLGLRVTA
jgi:hypothetical protein